MTWLCRKQSQSEADLREEVCRQEGQRGQRRQHEREDARRATHLRRVLLEESLEVCGALAAWVQTSAEIRAQKGSAVER